MSDRPPRLLFIPVSGRFGMGEYARSLAIADAAAARWPDVSLRFMLSRAAPYAARSPHPATLLDSSPTFHSAKVVSLIEEWRPDVVIFDNAGRTAQLRAAHRCGARVIYISSRPRQRRKAFRMRWMRLIDEHWIAYPQFIAGSFSLLERLRLRALRRPRVRYLDVILAPACAPLEAIDASTTGVAFQNYVLMVPGGGTGHPGAADAVEQFVAAARGLAALGVDTIIVGREPATIDVSPPHLRQLAALPQAELARLMRGAHLIIANGGSTLLQSIACGKACIAVPIAGDQRERIRRCAAVGVAIACAPDALSMQRAAAALLEDEASLAALAERAAALGLTDGVAVALGALEALFAGRPGS